MCKNLKKIIETNLKDQLNLQLLRQFAETIKDILKINQSLTNQCMKQNGNIYSKFYEAINSCCQYTVKKCTKEIEKLRGEDDHRDEDQEELEKDTRQQPLEDEVGRVKDF